VIFFQSARQLRFLKLWFYCYQLNFCKEKYNTSYLYFYFLDN